MTSPAQPATVPTPSGAAPARKSTRAGDAAVEDVCSVCPHPVAQHDRISARFGAATTAQVARGQQTNPGCSCP